MHLYPLLWMLAAKSCTAATKHSIGNDYLVIGTLAKAVWKRGTQQQMTLQEVLEALHDFKEVVTFKLTGGWVRDEAKPSAKKRGSGV